jgi:hypothetical protein
VLDGRYAITVRCSFDIYLFHIFIRAHSVLFAGELPFFKTLLPLQLQEEMAAFAHQQKLLKQQIKLTKSKISKKSTKKTDVPS